MSNRPKPAGVGSNLSRDVDVGRPVRVINTETTAAPSFAALEIWGWDKDVNAYKVRKATVSGRNDLLFNGPIPIPSNNTEGQAFSGFPCGAAFQVQEGEYPLPGQSWGVKAGEWTLSINYPGYVVRDVSAVTRGFMIVGTQRTQVSDFIKVDGPHPTTSPDYDDLPDSYLSGEMLIHDPVIDDWVSTDPPTPVWFANIFAGDVATDGTFYNFAVRTGFTLGRPVYISCAAAVSGVWKKSVRAATTANGALSTAFANGQTVDGVVLATGNRILLKNQTAGGENGIYVVQATGAPVRATDCDSEDDFISAVVRVSEGTVNRNTFWVCTTIAPIVVGTTATVWSSFGASADFFARLTVEEVVAGVGTNKWKWIPLTLNSSGVWVDDGVQSAGYTAIASTIDGTTYGGKQATLRVKMWPSKQLGFYECQPVGYATENYAGLVSITDQIFRGKKTFIESGQMTDVPAPNQIIIDPTTIGGSPTHIASVTVINPNFIASINASDSASHFKITNGFSTYVDLYSDSFSSGLFIGSFGVSAFTFSGQNYVELGNTSYIGVQLFSGTTAHVKTIDTTVDTICKLHSEISYNRDGLNQNLQPTLVLSDSYDAVRQIVQLRRNYDPINEVTSSVGGGNTWLQLGPGSTRPWSTVVGTYYGGVSCSRLVTYYGYNGAGSILSGNGFGTHAAGVVKYGITDTFAVGGFTFEIDGGIIVRKF